MFQEKNIKKYFIWIFKKITLATCTSLVLKSVCMWYTYSSVLVCVLYTKSFHCSQDGGETLNGVAIDHRYKLLYVVSREPIFMDNPDAYTQQRIAIIETHAPFKHNRADIMCVHICIRLEYVVANVVWLEIMQQSFLCFYRLYCPSCWSP